MDEVFKRRFKNEIVARAAARIVPKHQPLCVKSQRILAYLGTRFTSLSRVKAGRAEVVQQLDAALGHHK